MTKISNHFSWKEALFLPQWGREATADDGLTPVIRANLVVLFSKMDKIRDHFQKPINVHVSYRPEKYNELVKGAPKSAHLSGLACDFDVQGMTCADVRKDILDNKLLDTLEMRMEDKPNSTWIHLDLAKPNPNRFFKP